MKRIATIAVFVVLFAQPAYSQGKSSTTAAEIVARLLSAYSSCRTYSDEGEVKLHSESSMNLWVWRCLRQIVDATNHFARRLSDRQNFALKLV